LGAREEERGGASEKCAEFTGRRLECVPTGTGVGGSPTTSSPSTPSVGAGRSRAACMSGAVLESRSRQSPCPRDPQRANTRDPEISPNQRVCRTRRRARCPKGEEEGAPRGWTRRGSPRLRHAPGRTHHFATVEIRKSIGGGYAAGHARRSVPRSSASPSGDSWHTGDGGALPLGERDDRGRPAIEGCPFRVSVVALANLVGIDRLRRGPLPPSRDG
jgi:hypothetical protein